MPAAYLPQPTNDPVALDAVAGHGARLRRTARRRVGARHAPRVLRRGRGRVRGRASRSGVAHPRRAPPAAGDRAASSASRSRARSARPASARRRLRERRRARVRRVTRPARRAGAGRSTDPRQPAADNRIDNFRFHPDYRIDRILFREIIGTVTDAVYVRPHARARRCCAIAAGDAPRRASRGIASWAVDREHSTPSGDAPARRRDRSRASSYASRDGFGAALEYAVLFPLAGLDNPAAHLSAQPAQLAPRAPRLAVRRLLMLRRTILPHSRPRDRVRRQPDAAADAPAVRRRHAAAAAVRAEPRRRRSTPTELQAALGVPARLPGVARGHDAHGRPRRAASTRRAIASGTSAADFADDQVATIAAAALARQVVRGVASRAASSSRRSTRAARSRASTAQRRPGDRACTASPRREPDRPSGKTLLVYAHADRALPLPARTSASTLDQRRARSRTARFAACRTRAPTPTTSRSTRRASSILPDLTFTPGAPRAHRRRPSRRAAGATIVTRQDVVPLRVLRRGRARDEPAGRDQRRLHDRRRARAGFGTEEETRR